jgi:hypothetical protein
MALSKSRFWSSAYADDEALKEAAVTAWCKAVLEAGLMKTVCSASCVQ